MSSDNNSTNTKIEGNDSLNDYIETKIQVIKYILIKTEFVMTNERKKFFEYRINILENLKK